MPADNHESELEKIFRIIQKSEGDVSLDKILVATRHIFSKSTLARRIRELVTEGRVEVLGAGKATRYRVAQGSREQSKAASSGVIVFSKTGSAIAKDMRRPIQQRIPVGYNSAILEMYTPRKSRFLAPALTQKLFRLGQVNPSGDVRPAGTYARQMLDRLLIELSWNSSRLEGNTYSLLDTKRLIAEGVRQEGKTNFESQMILNHKNAIEFLIEDAESIRFNHYTIKNLHAIISDNLLGNADDSGRLRTIEVGIEGSVYIPPAVPQKVEEQFGVFLKKAELIQDPFEQAFFAMAFIPYIQPFVDGNKRTSRLAANIPFIKRNLCPLSFIDVPERDYTDGIIGFYELGKPDLLRDVFVWAYERSALRYAAIRQSLGEPDPFKMQYRLEIMDVVRTLVRDKKHGSGESRKKIVALAKQNRIEPNDLEKFVDVILTELHCLHDGNFARFKIRPSEFETWKKSRE